MNNLVTVNNVGVNINNPTSYCPDLIIRKYIVAQGTNVAAEIANRTAKGLTQAGAAQDLFVRAVRHDEQQRNRKIAITHIARDALLIAALIDIVSESISVESRLFRVLKNFILYFFVAYCGLEGNYFIDDMREKLGLVGHYSV